VIDEEGGFVPLAGGGELAYQIRGRGHGGTPILLVRPLGGSVALWGAFRAALVERFRVVSFDHRGSGHSSAAPLGHTTKAMARDTLALLEHLRIDRAHVFGISLGGMTATWLAILAPDRVARLCLASAPARGLDLTQAGLRRGLSLAASFVRPAGEVEATLARRILSRRFKKADPEATRRIARPLEAEPASRADIAKHAFAGALHDARRELSRITAPTLVLAGDEDTLLGHAPQLELCRGIPGARFESVPRCGHDLTLEQPLATAERVLRFFGAP
jgi:3-oxoadipate enol-lactonase